MKRRTAPKSTRRAGARRLERPKRTALAVLKNRFGRLRSLSISGWSSAVSFSRAWRHSRTYSPDISSRPTERNVERTSSTQSFPRGMSALRKTGRGGSPRGTRGFEEPAKLFPDFAVDRQRPKVLLRDADEDVSAARDHARMLRRPADLRS